MQEKRPACLKRNMYRDLYITKEAYVPQKRPTRQDLYAGKETCMPETRHVQSSVHTRKPACGRCLWNDCRNPRMCARRYLLCSPCACWQLVQICMYVYIILNITIHSCVIHMCTWMVFTLITVCSKLIQRTLQSDTNWLRYSSFSVISRVKSARHSIHEKHVYSWLLRVST